MTRFFQKKRNKKKGFALLLAVLISGIVLAIGLSILNITLKQYIFSNLGRESEIAFYAADAGMECALYWDASSDGGNFEIGFGGADISCMGVSVRTNPPQSGSGVRQSYQFAWITGDPPQNLCAKIDVTKYIGPTPIPDNPDCPEGSVCTILESRGYNSGCTVTSPRTVERALKAVY